jgi:hypothetical protein
LSKFSSPLHGHIRWALESLAGQGRVIASSAGMDWQSSQVRLQSGGGSGQVRLWSGEALVRWRLIRWQLWTMCHYRSLAPPCWPCPSHMAQVPHWLRAPEVPPSSATLHFLPPSNKIALFREGHLKCMFWAWLPVRHLGLVRFALWSPILLLCVLFCF